MEDIDIIEVLDVHRMRTSTQFNDCVVNAMLYEEQARDTRIAEIMARFLMKQGEGEYVPNGIDWVTWLSMQN